MKRAAIIVAKSTSDTTEGATLIQTPSQAEHGLESSFIFCAIPLPCRLAAREVGNGDKFLASACIGSGWLFLGQRECGLSGRWRWPYRHLHQRMNT